MMLLALLLAIAATVPEGDVQAFPGLTDARGTPLAEGRYVQKVEGDVLHIEARYDFPGGRTVVERATLRLHPQLEKDLCRHRLHHRSESAQGQARAGAARRSARRRLHAQAAHCAHHHHPRRRRSGAHGGPRPGDKYTIHVDIPGIVRLFVDPPDLHIWLVNGDPPAFPRFEGPLVEPKDPVVRVDLIPGAVAHEQPRSARSPAATTRRAASPRPR
jgi:hypothetical protein